MRHKLCYAMLMLSLLFVTGEARGEAGGWHAPTDNGDRYNGGGGGARRRLHQPLRRIQRCGRREVMARRMPRRRQLEVRRRRSPGPSQRTRG